MENIKIHEILDAVNGELLSGSLDESVSSVSVSSKSVDEGALFVPLCGEKTDAHDFIDDALKNGALCTLTQRDCKFLDDKIYIKVLDTKKALQDLAYYYRKKFDIPFIGVTGSVGKSSTKEMIASALSVNNNVLKTSGNQNSQIGLPLTIFRVENKHDIAVIEMGISEFSEMDNLARIAQVDRAVVTNIGISHIENLKTRENIRDEKLKIILGDNGNHSKTLFLNGDEPLLTDLKNINAKKIYFGLSENCDYQAKNIKTTDYRTSFTLSCSMGDYDIEIPAIGIHNVYNALSAIAVGVDLGINISDIKAGLMTYKGLAMRQEIHRLHGGITVIDDSYNASPDSIKSGINVLTEVCEGNRTIVVLADMLELGEKSYEAHYELGKFCVEKNVDIIITIGREARNIAAGAMDKNKNAMCKSFDNNDDATKYLKTIIKQGDTILVKGSRSMRTDNIVKNLIDFYK